MHGDRIIVDSGPLYALFDRDDRYHSVSRAWFAGNRRPVVTNAAVLTEVSHLLGRWCGADHQLLFLEFVEQPGWSIEPLSTDLSRIRSLMNRYRNLPADFTDASLVALAERLHSTDVVSTDHRDFSIYQPRHAKRLTNLLELPLD